MTATEPSVGFVLQPTYRIVSGRPVIHLYGTLRSGGSFLVRDTRQVPHFFVRERDEAAARNAGATPLSPTGRVTLRGEPVLRVEVATPSDAPSARERLRASGVPCYEADVRFATRYLVDRGIRGSLSIRGAARPAERGMSVYDDPQIAPSDWTPRLGVVALDIETDPRASRILSVALHGCGAEEVLLVAPPNRPRPAGAVSFGTERALLEAMCARIVELDPDVLTGWNVIDFDLAVIAKIASRLGVSLDLGREPGPLRIRSARFSRGMQSASVPGRVVLDGLNLVRGAFIKTEDYSLETVARSVLGRGKTFHGGDRAEEILRTYREDTERFVEYNLNDARLVTEILDRLGLIDLTVERSRLTGMPPDRVSSSIASFDFLYMSELQKRSVVAPTVGFEEEPDVPTSGGQVLDPAPGLYRNVLVFDFKSLYPSIIRTFQIDPLGYLPGPDAKKDAIRAPNGACFSRGPGILPGILDELFPRREAAIAAGNRVASQAIKILMNSFYGVLATPACRFHNSDIANAVTGFGRELLLRTKSRIESAGKRVLYGDTDSLFVLSDEGDEDAARRLGERMAAELNEDLAEYVRTTHGVESRLTLEFETLYLKLLLPAVRRGTAGARKRYAGLVRSGDTTRVEFTGLEVVRRDWTDLAKKVQRELYERLFAEQPVEEYLREIVVDVRAGKLNDLVVYRKALRKGLDDYTATTPPHVAAARKMTTTPGRLIAYVMTTDGPEPADEVRSPIDPEHYVQKQVRPVAEPVLSLLRLDFDRIVEGNVQKKLFE